MPADDQSPSPRLQSNADRARRKPGPLVDVKTQRSIAKAGVLAALGVLVWTGMQRPRRRYMPLHTWTGMALIGLTLWHWSLYLPRSEKPGRGPGRASPSGGHGLPPAPAAED